MKMKYKICDWEDNGYHDSYFYGVMFDTETETLERRQYASTAFGGCDLDWTEAVDCTPEIAEEARKILVERIFEMLRKVEDMDCLEPEIDLIKKGEPVLTLEKHSYYVKGAEPCRKCSGTGYWINPRNNDDKRECFACHGTGHHNHKEFKLTEAGKRERDTIEIGTELIPIETPTFYGTQVRGGYNKPHRFNTTVRVMHNNQLVRFPVEKLRLKRDPLSDDELRVKAENLSHNMQFGAAYGCRAWLSNNWALKAKEKGVIGRETPLLKG